MKVKLDARDPNRKRLGGAGPGAGMDKRSLLVNLLLVALGFVGLLHTALSFVFPTGLRSIGALLVVLSVVGLLLVNVAAP